MKVKTGRKPTVLWVADAVVHTGFSRVTHNVLDYLQRSWDVHLLGLNYLGDPHPYPYAIYPAVIGGDTWGIGRLKELIEKVKPDVIVINNDPWNIALYLKEIQDLPVPIVAYMPIDARNQMTARHLNPLALAIAYTDFGKRELKFGGYMGDTDVIPHGVDANVYHPMDKIEARKALSFSKDVSLNAFIFGNVNRNQPRKRLDLTLQYFAEWWVRAGQPRDAHIFLHASNRDIGFQLTQLAAYYGVLTQLIMTNPNMNPSHGVAEVDMLKIYNAFDVQLNTGLGEGWGLTTHEGMACGVPQILPDYAAFGEWCKDAAVLVPCTTFAATPQTINTIGAIPDMEEFILAMDTLYHDAQARERWGLAGFRRATEPRFRWVTIAKQFHQALMTVVMQHRDYVAAMEASPATTEQEASHVG